MPQDRSRATCHTKYAPDLRLLHPIDDYGIMSPRASRIRSFLTRLIIKHSAVDHHRPAINGELVTERIAMRMSGLIVRTDRPTIDDDHIARLLADIIPA